MIQALFAEGIDFWILLAGPATRNSNADETVYSTFPVLGRIVRLIPRTYVRR